MQCSAVQNYYCPVLLKCLKWAIVLTVSINLHYRQRKTDAAFATQSLLYILRCISDFFISKKMIFWYFRTVFLNAQSISCVMSFPKKGSTVIFAKNTFAHNLFLVHFV